MPSIVDTDAVPTEEIGVWQPRTAAPSRCTVQAPHNPAPQPNLLPFKSSSSRRTQSKGMSPSTSMVRDTPLILIVYAMSCLLGPILRAGQMTASYARKIGQHQLQSAKKLPNRMAA